MGSSSQEAPSLSQYHWLFSDDSSESSDTEYGHLPMLPRVLTYEEPSPASACTEKVPAIAPDEPPFEQFSPSAGLFKAYNPSLLSHTSGDAFEILSDPGARSCPHTFSDGFQPALQPRLKRLREDGYEEESRPNKQLRSSTRSIAELLPDFNPTPPSPIMSTASTVSPLVNTDGDSIRENSLSWWLTLEVQDLKFRLATSEAQAAANSSLLSDTQACLMTLMTELRKIIASASRRDHADHMSQVISAVDHRVNSYLQTFPMMNDLVSSWVEVPTGLVQGSAQSTFPCFHQVGALNPRAQPKKPQSSLAVSEVDRPTDLAHPDYALCSGTQSGYYDAFPSMSTNDVPSLPVDSIPSANWAPVSSISRQSFVNSSNCPDNRQDAQTMFYHQMGDDQFLFGVEFGHQLTCNAGALASPPPIAHASQCLPDLLLWPTLPFGNPSNQL